MANLLLLLHLASTLFMTGLIWFVQAVHYPLFARVGQAEFSAYSVRHRSLTTWIVAPVMVIEAATGVGLLGLRPAEVPEWSVWIGLGLLLTVWISTALVQVPCHEALGRCFDEAVHRRLVRSNALRTAAWSCRAGLVLWMTGLCLR